MYVWSSVCACACMCIKRNPIWYIVLSLSKVVSTISFAIVGYSPILFIPVRSYLLKGIKTNTTALSRLMKGYQLIDYIDLTHQSHAVNVAKG